MAVNEVGEVGMAGLSSDSRGAMRAFMQGHSMSHLVRPPTAMEKTVAIKETE